MAEGPSESLTPAKPIAQFLGQLRAVVLALARRVEHCVEHRVE
jgi:hypothetical protein